MRYEVDGAAYLEISNWLSHQKIDKPSESKLPSPREDSRKLSKPTRRIKEGIKERTKEREPSGFADFWSAYPRKTAKGEAEKAFDKLSPDAELLAKLLGAIALQKLGEQWRKDGGQFIPHPATWLNQRRWEDEAPAQIGQPSDDIFAGAK